MAEGASGDADTIFAPGREAAVPAGEFRRGDSLGRYTVLTRLGAGGMGVVYSAFDPDLDRRVAIKVLRVERGSDSDSDSDEDTERLLREAQAMARLSHPNVVVVHDVGTHRERVWVAMEFVDGGTLHDWMKKPRPWRAVLEKFRAAGRGLAAAHSARLVHRDFKPANVLLGVDGRVLVADFGLAREAEAVIESRPPSASVLAQRAVAQSAASRSKSGTGAHARAPGPSASFTSLSARITETGALMGTPAYMSPEQIAGNVADARSDQFSFCVALYEALYGERPFAGDSLATILFAVERGKVRDPPRESNVPRWLRTVVVRGLAPDPDARHEDMPALLRRLDGTPRRARAAIGLVVGTLSVAAVVALRPTEAPVPMCTGGGEQLAAAYGPAERDAVAKSIRVRDTEHARATSDRVVERLDAYAKEWTEMYVDACEATHVRHEQSEDLLDRRMACLERRRRQLATTATVLASGGVDSSAGWVDKTLVMADALASVQACADREQLLVVVPLPDAPEARKRIADIEAKVDEVHVLRRAVRNEAAKALADESLELARNTQYAPLIAEAAVARGAVGSEIDDTTATAYLLEAYNVALAAGADSVAARAAQRLIAQYENDNELASAGHWVDLALATAKRAGSPPDVLGAIYTNIGNLRAEEGDPRGAVAAHEQARDYYTTAVGPEHERVADTMFNASSSLFSLGETERAAGLAADATEIWEKRLGKDHPRTMNGRAAQGMFAWQRGHLKLAIEMTQATVAHREALYGVSHTRVAETLVNLGAMQRQFGDPDAARETLVRARDLRIAASGPDHPWVARASGNLALVQVDLGDLDGALESAATTVRLMAPPNGPPTLEAAIARQIRGQVHLERGNLDQARADIEAAIHFHNAAMGKDDLSGNRESWAMLAIIEARAGNDAAARAAIKATTAGMAEIADSESFDRAHANELLADALWNLGERGRARALARTALDDFGGHEEAYPARVAAVRRWLKSHPARPGEP